MRECVLNLFCPSCVLFQPKNPLRRCDVNLRVRGESRVKGVNSTNSKKLSSVQNRYRYRMTDKTPATPPHAPPLTEDARNSHPRGSFRNGTTNNVKIITVVVNRRDDAFHYDVKTSRINLVQDVWEYEILSYLNVRELALLRPTCRWCNEQWQEFLKRNTFRVPEQVPTIDEAMRVGFNLAKQKVFSKEKPLVVVLGEGEHVPENTLDITCSNISFIGQSKDKTIVRGGFGVLNKKNVMYILYLLVHILPAHLPRIFEIIKALRQICFLSLTNTQVNMLGNSATRIKRINRFY